MKETTTTDIYNYLTKFQCDLNVCVTNNNNDIIEEGIAKKTSAMNGFYIGDNYTNIYLSGNTYKGLKFYANYPTLSIYNVAKEICNISGGGKEEETKSIKEVQQKKKCKNKKISLNILHKIFINL
jgi:hypothetical protein